MEAPLTPNPFERIDEGPSDPDGPSPTDRLFRTQPRLVPMALVWLGPLVLVVIAVSTHSMLNMRLKDVAEPATLWRLAMVLVALAPYVLVLLLPIVQRRHLTSPLPFYTYCRRVSLIIAIAYPVLWVTGWLVGPGGASGRSAAIFVTALMFGSVAALLPWAARLNHAAWLRVRAQSFPSNN